MKRFGFFILTNFMVMVTISILWSVINMFFPLQESLGNYGYLMFFSAIWGMGGAFISLYMSKWIAKKQMGVQIIDPHNSSGELRALVEKVHDYARKSGLNKMPEVGIYESPEINAFATGPSKNNSLVAVSTGLLHQMDQEGVEGVLGHEVAHIANGDMVTMTLIQGVVNAFVIFFAHILSRIVSSALSSDDERGGENLFITYALNMVFTMIFAFLGMFVVNYFSRIREYRADLGSAKVAGKSAMINALRQIQLATQRMEPVPVSSKDDYATLKISALGSTHPTIEDRIARLEKALV